MSKVISFSLDSASIGRAINELNRYIDEVKATVNDLVRTLAENGMRVAMVQLSMMTPPAVYTGELADSIIGFFDEESGVGIVRANADYAIFVEYGTGVVGARGLQHPDMEGEWKPPASQYTMHDTNGHGDDGWNYINEKDGHKYWTRGMAARPFMYETFKELEQMAVRLWNEKFGH